MKRILLNRLLMLQLAYSFAGVMYNVGSLLALRNELPAWAPTDPVMGAAGMSLVGLFVAAGLLKNLALYRRRPYTKHNRWTVLWGWVRSTRAMKRIPAASTIAEPSYT